MTTFWTFSIMYWIIVVALWLHGAVVVTMFMAPAYIIVVALAMAIRKDIAK